MLQCFEMFKINSLTVRSMLVFVNSIASWLIVGGVHPFLAHAFGVVLEGSSLAEVWAEEAMELFFQHEELVVWDSPHHMDRLSFSGGNSSDLSADCPLLEAGYPVHIWNLAGMLCSAYKKKNKLFLYSLTASATCYPNYST